MDIYISEFSEFSLILSLRLHMKRGALTQCFLRGECLLTSSAEALMRYVFLIALGTVAMGLFWVGRILYSDSGPFLNNASCSYSDFDSESVLLVQDPVPIGGLRSSSETGSN